MNDSLSAIFAPHSPDPMIGSLRLKIGETSRFFKKAGAISNAVWIGTQYLTERKTLVESYRKALKRTHSSSSKSVKGGSAFNFFFFLVFPFLALCRKSSCINHYKQRLLIALSHKYLIMIKMNVAKFSETKVYEKAFYYS